MKDCLNCQKEYENKREASKFCSTKCRVMWNRKNPSDKVTKVQMQVLYNEIMNRLDKIEFAPSKEVYDSPKMKITGDEYPKIQQPQIALKSFDQWREKKRECESEEEWEQIKAGILTATNLSPKQKDLLIKYS